MINGICILIWFSVVICVTSIILTIGYIIYARIHKKPWGDILDDIWDFINGEGCLG